MTQVPLVAVAPVPTSVSSYWSPLGVVVIAMGRECTIGPNGRGDGNSPVTGHNRGRSGHGDTQQATDASRLAEIPGGDRAHVGRGRRPPGAESLVGRAAES